MRALCPKCDVEHDQAIDATTAHADTLRTLHAAATMTLGAAADFIARAHLVSALSTLGYCGDCGGRAFDDIVRPVREARIERERVEGPSAGNVIPFRRRA